MNITFKHFIAIVSLAFFVACSGSDDGYTTVNEVTVPAENAFGTLSEYHFFTGGLSGLTPNTGVVPYDLNTPLFSDYSSKKRFAYVPNGSVIPYSTTGVLSFPTGSVLIKNFYYPQNGVNKILETRLLLKTPSGWKPETYIWNDEQTEAQRSLIGGTVNLTVNVNGTSQDFDYKIPNQNQCVNCHSSTGSINIIGPRVQNLNKNYTYASGTSNQIEYWVQQGILANPNTNIIPSWPNFNDTSSNLNERARAYLDVNCASCHTENGAAANSGLFLHYDNKDSSSLGILKPPVAAGNGSGGFTYVIDPGNSEESILLFRMNSSEVDIRMPEIGRELIHNEGVQLIQEWIDNL
ncbi:MAG: SO2930 family diheme c-type cytochrome [Marinirhabdus sp.]